MMHASHTQLLGSRGRGLARAPIMRGSGRTSRALPVCSTSGSASDPEASATQCGASSSPAPGPNIPPRAQPALIVLAHLAQQRLRKLSEWLRQARVEQLLFGGQLLAGQRPAAMAAVAAASLAMPALPNGGVTDLFSNCVFLAGFYAWFAAQFLKIFTRRFRKGVWDIRAMVDSGGMPSSHSALCAGITTAIAMQHGMGSTTFALAVALTSIVMYDAAGVRRHAGKQAEVLNQVIGELLAHHPVSQEQLKEVLGHTPVQVGAGALLGILFGYFFPYGSFPPPASVVLL